MKAYLRSVRIAPKKANLVAKMIRGIPVQEAMHSLNRTNKKAARILEDVLSSAMANAKHNDKQNPDELIVKTIIVNKAITYHRGIPMARGRMRRIRKILSHISIELGYSEVEQKKKNISDKDEKVNRLRQGYGGQERKKEKLNEVKIEESKVEPKHDSSQSNKSKKKPQSGSQSKKTPVKTVRSSSKLKKVSGESKKISS